MSSPVAVLYNSDKSEAKKALPPLIRWLKAAGVPAITALSAPELKRAQFAVVLGGDGTILRVAKTLAPLGVPILGVNLGRLGFMAEIDLKDLRGALKKALEGRLRCEERLMLRVTLHRGGASKPRFESLALNECAIHSGATPRMVETRAALNGEPLASYVGDGLIVSTPTGSTAYSLAAFGPIASPELPVILLTPICAHTLAQRPLLISSGEVLELTVQPAKSSNFALLTVDGQETAKAQRGDKVIVRAASHRLKLLVDPGRSYYEILRTKLGWGER